MSPAEHRLCALTALRNGVNPFSDIIAPTSFKARYAVLAELVREGLVVDHGPASSVIGRKRYELVDEARRAIVATCACGRRHTRAAWDELAYVGKVEDDVEPLELRNCVCGSTITVPAAARAAS